VLEYQVGNFSQGEHYLQRLGEATLLAHSGFNPEDAILAMEIPLVARITGELQMEDTCKRVAQDALSSPSTVPLIALLARIGLALLAVCRDDAGEARQQYAALENTMPGIILVELSGDRLLGLLSHTMGEPDRAAAHFENAQAFCRKIGCWPELAWTCFDYANLLLQPDSPEHRARAISLLEESLSISTELGMAPLIEQASALQHQVESRPPAAPTYPDGLTHREVEVLLLVARGKSNREIAEELVISPNTVVSHVSNIFNKIGAANRTEAATYAGRNGLLSW
jgi:DNA-binding CsgD family transcriptional regulator